MNSNFRFLTILCLLVLVCYVIMVPNKRLICADKKGSYISEEIKYKKEIEKAIREINQFVLSDSLWKMWQSVRDSQFVIPQTDTTGALKRLGVGSQKAKKAVQMIQQISESMDSLKANKIKLDAILELEKARVDLEESIKLNPYDHRTQKWLVWIFQQLADLHTERENYGRATTMLEYLAYILKDDPQLFYKLGENYLWLGNWKKARENLMKSINLVLDSDWETINTDELFFHYSLRAEAEIQMGMVQEALLTLNYAKLIAPSPEEEQRIQWQIKWINWDDGNLTNSIKYDELKEKFKNCKDHNKLISDYMTLLGKLTTNNAKNEIHWQISKLEFQFLNKRVEAIMRLFNVIREIEIDSLGVAIELENQRYLNDYGLMCYNLGVENLKQNDYKVAYIYFTQSAAIHWEGIGKSYFQLAYISNSKNDVAIQLCNKALQFRNSLSLTEIYQTYELLFNSYKRKGVFDQAELWYQKLVNVQ